MDTVGDCRSALEESLADVLLECLPQTAGYSLEVDILENDRKKRSTASRESWRPTHGEIRIRFGGPVSTPVGAARSSHPEPPVNQRSSVSRPGSPDQAPGTLLRELVCALFAAEQRPGFEFVALKWFRDLFLPAQGRHWSENAVADRAIRNAVEEGAVLTYKVPNPKSPAFPVTAIRLNRQHPEVAAILGSENRTPQGFAPVDIRGEPLSTTVLSERR